DHEEDSGEDGDPAGGVARDRPESHREDADDGEEGRPADHAAYDPRVRERDLENVVIPQDRLAADEAEDHRGHHQHEGGDRGHGDVGPENREPLRHGAERGADHPGRVLPRDDQDAEHADRELGEVHAGGRDLDGVAVQPLLEAHVTPTGDRDGREDAGEPDREHDRDEERPQCRAERAELGPLRDDDPPLGHLEPADPLGNGTCRRRNDGHATASSASRDWPGVMAWNSTSSRVTSMNASSSEARTGVSSCRTMRRAAAASPTCSAVRPITSSAPSSAGWTETSAPASASAGVVAWGEPTRTTFLEALRRDPAA